MSAACVPMTIENRFVGVTGFDFSMDKMRDMISKIKPYGNGYGALVSDTGLIVAHPEEELIGKNIKAFVSQKTYDSILKGESTSQEFSAAKTGKKNIFVFAPISPGDTGANWSLAVSAPVDEIMTEAISLRNNQHHHCRDHPFYTGCRHLFYCPMPLLSNPSIWY